MQTEGCKPKRLRYFSMMTDTDTTYPKVKPNFNNIPDALKSLPWAVWKAEPRTGQPGKFNKRPLTPQNGYPASTNKLETFGTFDQAQAAYEKGGYSGVGVLLTGNGIVGVDIDDFKTVFNQTPSVQAWVTDAVKSGAYCEQSPSGEGLRLFMRGKLPGKGRKHANLEIYGDVRFLTVTGKVTRMKGANHEN
jgi:primase-polymerase (primpol)-like protein